MSVCVKKHECQVQHGCVRALSTMQQDQHARKYALKTWYVAAVLNSKKSVDDDDLRR